MWKDTCAFWDEIYTVRKESYIFLKNVLIVLCTFFPKRHFRVHSEYKRQIMYMDRLLMPMSPNLKGHSQNSPVCGANVSLAPHLVWLQLAIRTLKRARSFQSVLTGFCKTHYLLVYSKKRPTQVKRDVHILNRGPYSVKRDVHFLKRACWQSFAKSTAPKTGNQSSNDAVVPTLSAAINGLPLAPSGSQIYTYIYLFSFFESVSSKDAALQTPSAVISDLPLAPLAFPRQNLVSLFLKPVVQRCFRFRTYPLGCDKWSAVCALRFITKNIWSFVFEEQIQNSLSADIVRLRLTRTLTCVCERECVCACENACLPVCVFVCVRMCENRLCLSVRMCVCACECQKY